MLLFFVSIIDLKEYSFPFYGLHIYECIDVNTALKNSFKSMSCLRRIQQFPRNFLCWQALVVSSYSFKSMKWPEMKGYFILFRHQDFDHQGSCTPVGLLLQWEFHLQMVLQMKLPLQEYQPCLLKTPLYLVYLGRREPRCTESVHDSSR
jgi:hypothetical protein